MNCYTLPFWLSSQTYILKDKTYLACIFNHKSNELIELEGLSALLWKLLSEGKSNSEILKVARKNQFENELEDFLEELHSVGILLINDNKEEDLTNIRPYNRANLYGIMGELDFCFQKLDDNGFLPNLFFELTYNCNLKCVHCFNDKNLKEQPTFEDVKPIIDEAIKLGTFFITLSGGECTLNKDFIKIAQYIREKRLALCIYTNGQTFYDNPELLEKVVNLYPFEIALSLYSMNSEIHEKITGIKGSYHKTLSVIKKLKEKNINVRINSFQTKYNPYDCKEIQEFAKENNVSCAIDYELINNPDKSNSDVRITEEQLLKMFKANTSLYKIDNFKIIEFNDVFMKKALLCSAGHKAISINPNLDIYTCPTLKIPLGNYKNVSLKELWKNKDNKSSKLYKIRNIRRIDLSDCYKHEYCKYCSYCLGIALSEGSFLKKNKTFCKEAKIRMKVHKELIK